MIEYSQQIHLSYKLNLIKKDQILATSQEEFQNHVQIARQHEVLSTGQAGILGLTLSTENLFEKLLVVDRHKANISMNICEI